MHRRLKAPIWEKGVRCDMTIYPFPLILGHNSYSQHGYVISVVHLKKWNLQSNILIFWYVFPLLFSELYTIINKLKNFKRLKHFSLHAKSVEYVSRFKWCNSFLCLYCNCANRIYFKTSLFKMHLFFTQKYIRQWICPHILNTTFTEPAMMSQFVSSVHWGGLN